MSRRHSVYLALLLFAVVAAILIRPLILRDPKYPGKLRLQCKTRPIDLYVANPRKLGQRTFQSAPRKHPSYEGSGRSSPDDIEYYRYPLDLVHLATLGDGRIVSVARVID